MSQWPATQLSTESGRAPTADELLVNVKQLIEQFRSKSNATNRVVFSDTTSQYTLIVTSLSDMLSQFPTMSSKATKKELDEAIPLARHSLEAIELVSRRMEGALAGQEYALTSKLLVCLGTIEEWEQSNSNTFQAPYELRDNIIRVLTGLFALRVTETFATEQKYDDGLSAIKNSLEEIFSTFNGAFIPLNSNDPTDMNQATHASLTSIYPDTLTLFENPTKHSMKVGQEVNIITYLSTELTP
jgi:DNA-binding transcriptional regulator YiaG